MHTSQTTHHRIFFGKVTNPDYLEGLSLDLGLEKVDDTTYDLCLEEGTSLSVEAACRIAVKVAALGNEQGDPEDLQFMLGCMARLLAERGYTPHSTTFDADVDLELLVDQDISCLELFDLLSALSYGYEVKGIYSQWAMFSNKNEFGANAGGTRITTRHFSVPCAVYPDRAESFIELLSKHGPNDMGDVYVMEFILPLIEGQVLSKALQMSIMSSLSRFFGGIPIKGVEDAVVQIAPNVAPRHHVGHEYSMLTGKRKPKLSDFRYFQPDPALRHVDADTQFWLAWYGWTILDVEEGRVTVPENHRDTVRELCDLLAGGQELVCPAITKYNEEHTTLNEKFGADMRPSDVFPISPGFVKSTLESMERQGIDPRDIEIKGVHLRDSHVPRDVLEQGRDVIDRETHRPVASERPSIPSVMVLEKSGPDYSEVTSSRQSFAEPSPPSSVESSSSSDNNSSPTSD